MAERDGQTMIASANVWGVGIALAITVPIVLAACFVAFVIHRNEQDDPVRFSLPRIIPWTAASRARNIRAQTELEEATANLYDIRHKRLQKETVFRDLENNVLDRALGKGSDD